MIGKNIFALDVTKCILSCALLSVASCSHGISNDYIPKFVTSLNEIDTNQAALIRGVEITPIGVGDKSMHPHGEFFFRLRIDTVLYINHQCTSIIELKVHDRDFELVYAETINLAAMSKFERAITVQRPNQLVIFAGDFDEQCSQQKERLPETVVFDVNKIYADIVRKKVADTHDFE